MNVGIIVAAGKGERMGARVDKAFVSLGVKPVLAYSLEVFEECTDIDAVIIVAKKDRLAAARGMAQMFGCAKAQKVVAGGLKRQDSVQAGLAALGEDVRHVVIHDAARPCVTTELISATLKAAKRYGAGLAAVKIADTIKRVERGTTVSETVDRSKLWSVQTPQAFKLELLQQAYDLVNKKGLTVTDEGSAVELVSDKVHIVPSTWTNIKITTAEDLPIAAAMLKVPV